MSNRRQKAIESRYQKTHKDHMEKLRDGGLLKRLRKVDKYFQIVAEGRVQTSGSDFLVMDEDRKTLTLISHFWNEDEEDYKCLLEAWKKWHNSPLMKALQ